MPFMVNIHTHLWPAHHLLLLMLLHHMMELLCMLSLLSLLKLELLSLLFEIKLRPVAIIVAGELRKISMNFFFRVEFVLL